MCNAVYQTGDGLVGQSKKTVLPAHDMKCVNA